MSAKRETSMEVMDRMVRELAVQPQPDYVILVPDPNPLPVLPWRVSPGLHRSGSSCGVDGVPVDGPERRG